MLPTFKPNNYVVCLKSKRIKANDVVVLEEENLGKILKRVTFFDGVSLNLEGDNKSYESEVYKKTYNVKDILGKVIFKF
jgi:phage repressor protein C with HTH and peptisase S24 domain|tara:strand:+ start:1781 stop:2017 length:237 start_codon:yes stop_codon:yes gene_type:complete